MTDTTNGATGEAREGDVAETPATTSASPADRPQAPPRPLRPQRLPPRLRLRPRRRADRPGTPRHRHGLRARARRRSRTTRRSTNRLSPPASDRGLPGIRPPTAPTQPVSPARCRRPFGRPRPRRNPPRRSSAGSDSASLRRSSQPPSSAAHQAPGSPRSSRTTTRPPERVCGLRAEHRRERHRVGQPDHRGRREGEPERRHHLGRRRPGRRHGLGHHPLRRRLRAHEHPCRDPRRRHRRPDDPGEDQRRAPLRGRARRHRPAVRPRGHQARGCLGPHPARVRRLRRAQRRRHGDRDRRAARPRRHRHERHRERAEPLDRRRVVGGARDARRLRRATAGEDATAPREPLRLLLRPARPRQRRAAAAHRLRTGALCRSSRRMPRSTRATRAVRSSTPRASSSASTWRSSPQAARRAEAGNIGVGFAVPSNLAERIANEIIENGAATHGLLGATVTSAEADGRATRSAPSSPR